MTAHRAAVRNAGRRSTGLSFNVKTFAVGAAAKGVGDAVGGTARLVIRAARLASIAAARLASREASVEGRMN